MKKKLLCFSFCLLIIFSVLVVPCNALSINDTYSDLAYNNTNANNLLTYAMNYDSFLNSQFVIFRSDQYEYYIVWGDLSLSGSTVVADDTIEYIRYYRISENYNSEYKYQYGTDDNFSLKSDYVNTSNIDGYGFKSPTFITYKHEYNVSNILVFVGAFAFVIMLVKLRRD